MSPFVRAILLLFIAALSTPEAAQSDTCLATAVRILARKKPSSTIDVLATFETQIQNLKSDFAAHRTGDLRLEAQIKKLEERYEDAYLGAGSDSALDPKFQAEAKDIASRLDKARDSLRILDLREKNFDFAKATQDPRILRQDRLYEINGLDPNVKRVSFSKDVLENIFWSDQPFFQKTAEYIFRGLSRGKKFVNDKGGIVAFTHESDIFKVKITGTSQGAVRVAGFFDGSDFHIVAWSQEAKHNDYASSMLVEKVKRERDAFAKARLQ